MIGAITGREMGIAEVGSVTGTEAVVGRAEGANDETFRATTGAAVGGEGRGDAEGDVVIPLQTGPAVPVFEHSAFVKNVVEGNLNKTFWNWAA